MIAWTRYHLYDGRSYWKLTECFLHRIVNSHTVSRFASLVHIGFFGFISTILK